MKKFEKNSVSCKKNTANQNSSVGRTKQKRLIFRSNYDVCDEKKMLKILKIKK